MCKIGIIGDGGWGTALSLVLHSKGLKTILWSAFPEYAGVMREKKENVKFLKGISLPEDLKITSDESVFDGIEYAIIAVPSEYLRIVAERFSKINIKNIISATKGIENGSLKRPSQILEEVFPGKNIFVLSGPTIAGEVANKIPTTVVLASKSKEKEKIRELLSSENFRVYTSSDVLGVELGGALKNVIAIAAGISDGLGFGTNTKSAILTRGLAEITRLGVKMGADSITFSGLSGIGDLATTCINVSSRNRTFGENIGKGENIKKLLSSTEMVIEGMATCKSGHDLSKKYNVDMPITNKVYEVLYKQKSPLEAVKELMSRDLKEENYN